MANSVLRLLAILHPDEIFKVFNPETAERVCKRVRI